MGITNGNRNFVAVSGSGAIGYHPLDRKTWSGCSHAFFSEVQRRDRLHRGFGFDVSPLRRSYYMARNVHFDRQTWRKHFYMDTDYRNALTEEMRRRVEGADLGHDFVQCGAMFSGPEALDGRARCFSYHDSCLAESIKGLYAPKYVDARRVDKAMEYERRVYHAMTRVFTFSEYLRQSIIRHFGVAPDRVVAIGAGINLENIPEANADKRYDTREVLFLGADFKRKGGRELLQAFAAVRQNLPDAKLHIVGPAGLVIEPELAAGVEYHGYLDKTRPDDRAELDALFGRCSLFVLPSLYEPFGVAPLEAMAHQIPCLVSNAGALGHTVTPGETGDVAEAGSVEDLADRMERLLRDPEGLRRMGDNGRGVVLNRYTWGRVVDRFLAATAEAAPTA